MILGALALASSLYYTQVMNGGVYAAKADAQYTKPSNGTADRGTIYFVAKDGTKVAASIQTTGSLVFINPSQISNPSQIFEALSPYLKLDRASFLALAGKPNDHYEEIAQEVDANTAKTIQGLKLSGVGVSIETWRTYPGGTLAAHAIGLVGEDSSSTQVTGKYGVERTYEDVLARSNSDASHNVFADLFGGLQSVFVGGGSATAGDIVTTIEPTAQKYLETTLSDTEAEWHSDEIGGIIIDPKTGAIVAMGSLPTFNPNDVSHISNVSILSDPLVEHVYEFGSIMKPLTMATALDTGAEQPDSTYDDTGTLTLSGKKISNYDGRARGVIPMQEILSQSLNVGAATIALKVGKENFSKYFLNFGLGEKTNIDEPNEATGIVGNLKTGRDVEIATAAYGQGIAVSPVNMARALSILANGGYVVTPHVVSEVDYADGSVKKIMPSQNSPVLKKQTVDDVTNMLVKVVDTALKKGAIKMDRYSIAAKTGTAQIADHANGGYYSDRYLHSFFGYFPAYNPKFLVFLYQVNPKGAEYASATLTDPFEKITKFLIDYYNIAPDR